MSPILFMTLWCCGATVQGIVGVQTLLGRRVPGLFIPWQLWGKPDEEVQRKTKLQTILGCCTMFVVAMGFIGKGVTMLDTGRTHTLLTYSWHGLILHYALGAIAMILGVGMVRTALLKQLPRILTPRSAFSHGAITPKGQETILTIKATLIVLGLVVTEVGVLLSYFVTSAK